MSTEAQQEAEACDCGHPRVEHDYGVGECYLSGCKCRKWEAATDDHEALVEVMTAATFVDGERRLVGWGPIADAILAAGFRRAPAEPEPRGDDYEAGYAEGFHHGLSGPRASDDVAVQGEPTDAMVEAAARAWSGLSPNDWEKARARNALRAAANVHNPGVSDISTGQMSTPSDDVLEAACRASGSKPPTNRTGARRE